MDSIRPEDRSEYGGQMAVLGGRVDSVAGGPGARPGPENAGKILVLLAAAGPGRPCCGFLAYRLVASWKGLAAAVPAAQQVAAKCSAQATSPPPGGDGSAR
jgi:hypothetical protein